MRYVLYAILAWFLYNLIFKLIIPVYKTTRQVRKKFNEMQEEQRRQQSFYQTPDTQKPSPKPHSEDYIDFEEIR